MPITYLLAFFTLPVVFMSLSNPPSLIGAFIFVCVLIYTFKSVAFYRRNILLSTPAKSNTKDWIRINGVISLVFVLEIFVSVLVIFSKAPEMKQTLRNMLDSLNQQGSFNVSENEILPMLKGFMIFFSLYALLLLVHIIISFRFLKKYRHLFTN